jgi:hypothetical protein
MAFTPINPRLQDWERQRTSCTRLEFEHSGRQPTKKGMSQQRVNHEELIVHPQLDPSEGSLFTVPRKTTTQRSCSMLSDVAREDPDDNEI